MFFAYLRKYEGIFKEKYRNWTYEKKVQLILRKLSTAEHILPIKPTKIFSGRNSLFNIHRNCLNLRKKGLKISSCMAESQRENVKNLN